MSPNVKAFIDLDRDGRISVRTAFVKEFIDALKVSIPSPKREWDGVNKVWLVQRKMWPCLKRVLTNHFETSIAYSPAMEAALIEELGDEVADGPTLDFAVLGLRTDASLAVIHAAWAVIHRVYVKPEPWLDLPHGDLTAGLPSDGAARDAYERICALREVMPMGYNDGEPL